LRAKINAAMAMTRDKKPAGESNIKPPGNRP
jgi:hypothetical protein